MSNRMTMELDLSSIWERIVSAGAIRNRFTGIDGRVVECGVRMTAGGPQHYAIDIESGKEIGQGVVERPFGQSGFTLRWNPYRALKPKVRELPLGKQQDISPDVSQCFFACRDAANPLSLLRRNSAARVTFNNFEWTALYNALPVEQQGHFLWAPIRSYGAITTFPHWIQVMTLPLLEDFLAIGRASRNLMTFFNGLHAGASVNHMHYQSVYCAAETAIERASVCSVGGRRFLEEYPITSLVYGTETETAEIWRDVDGLQERSIPLNLLHRAGRTFLIPRNIEHEMLAEFPGGVLAGMELSGNAITTEEEYYRTAKLETVQRALSKSSLRKEDVLTIVRV